MFIYEAGGSGKSLRSVPPLSYLPLVRNPGQVREIGEGSDLLSRVLLSATDSCLRTVFPSPASDARARWQKRCLTEFASSSIYFIKR
jgi:hypothetical protein